MNKSFSFPKFYHLLTILFIQLYNDMLVYYDKKKSCQRVVKLEYRAAKE